MFHVEHRPTEYYLRNVRDHFVSGESFDLLWSDRKGVLKTDPVPHRLEDYYAGPEYASHEEGGSGWKGRMYRGVRHFQHGLKYAWVKRLSPKPGIALDVGTGTGEWPDYLSKRGWAVRATEPSAKGRSRATAKGVQITQDFMSLEGEAFDLITLWHVMEHIGSLDKALAQINRLCSPNGYVIVAVPNFLSWDAGHYGVFWAAWDVPRHIWHFSRAGLIALYEEHGFSLVRTYPLWADAFYVSLLSEGYKRGRASVVRALWSGLRSNMRSLLDSEPSSRVYVFQKLK